MIVLCPECERKYVEAGTTCDSCTDRFLDNLENLEAQRYAERADRDAEEIKYT